MVKSVEYIGQRNVTLLRLVIILVIIATCVYVDTIQSWVDVVYGTLQYSKWFQSVYFETIFATFCYTIIIAAYPFFVDKLRFMDVYKLHPSVQYEHVTIAKICVDLFFYITPLALMDTFMVKKYDKIDAAVLDEKRQSIIQYTRALPQTPPTVFELTYQLIGSLVLYDIIFFIVHFVLHKNYFLYKHIHKRHHDHELVHSHVTNQLAVMERIPLILSANQSLKIFRSHPLTRTIFIPIFVWILIDNHSGYDMPFGLHRIVPFGLVGGSVKHFEHHMNGKRNYQPIMSYLDSMLVWLGNRQKQTK